MEDKIAIEPAPGFRLVLKELSAMSGAPQNVKSYNKPLSKPVLLSTTDVKWCHARIQQYGLPYRIHTLLYGSKVVLPEYKPPPRNPELEARIEKLKAEQANKDYQAMIKNVHPSQFETASLQGFGKEVREMNRQLVTGAQYLLSVVGTFFAIFIGLGFATEEYGTRALVATLAAVLVGIAEIYFIIKQDMQEENGKQKTS